MTFEQHKADYYLVSSEYEFFTSSQFALPYCKIVEQNERSTIYRKTICLWEVVTFGFSDAVECTEKSVAYYEAILFDLLYSGYETGNLMSSLEKGVKATEASTLKSIVGEMGKAYGDVLKTDIANIGTILEYASTIEELNEKLSKYDAIKSAVDENMEILRDISASNASLIAACEKMANICSEQISEEAVIVLMVSEKRRRFLQNSFLVQCGRR